MKLNSIIPVTAVAFSSICSGLAIPVQSEQNNSGEVAKRVCTPYWACRLAPPKQGLSVVPIPDPPLTVIPIEDPPLAVIPIEDPPLTVVPIEKRAVSSPGRHSSTLNLGPLVPLVATQSSKPADTSIDIPASGLTFTRSLNWGPLVPPAATLTRLASVPSVAVPTTSLTPPVSTKIIKPPLKKTPFSVTIPATKTSLIDLAPIIFDKGQ